MKNTWIVACSLLLVAVAGLAETPVPPPLTGEALAMILGEPAATGSCAPRGNGVVLAAKGPRIGLGKALCTATANCGAGTTISCQDNTAPAACTAVDRNCSVGQRGYVACNGGSPIQCPCPCGGTIIDQACCQCDQTGDCFQCCRCDGGSAVQCSMACG